MNRLFVCVIGGLFMTHFGWANPTVVKSSNIVKGELQRANVVYSEGNVDTITPSSVVPLQKDNVVKRVNSAEQPAVVDPGTVVQKITVNAVESDGKDIRNWCSYRSPDELFVIDVERGYFGFVIKKGRLLDNVKRFVDSFYPKNQGVIEKIGEHGVIADACLIERSADMVIQKVIEPYQVAKKRVLYGVFNNDIHAVFYEQDSEFNRYLTGVR